MMNRMHHFSVSNLCSEGAFRVMTSYLKMFEKSTEQELSQH